MKLRVERPDSEVVDPVEATEHAIKAAQSLITLSIANVIGKIIMAKLIEALLVSPDRKERALGNKLLREFNKMPQ